MILLLMPNGGIVPAHAKKDQTVEKKKTTVEKVNKKNTADDGNAKGKKTQTPSSAPTQTASRRPTRSSTTAPSPGTTRVSTRRPTRGPTGSPTKLRTELPTASTASPSSVPSKRPVSGVTDLITLTPSGTPTLIPTTESQVTPEIETLGPEPTSAPIDGEATTPIPVRGILLPQMSFTFLLEPIDDAITTSSPSPASKRDTALRFTVQEFIENILSTNAAIPRTFEYSHLHVATNKAESTVNEGQGSNRQRRDEISSTDGQFPPRHLAAGQANKTYVSINGTAFFALSGDGVEAAGHSNVISQVHLANVFRAYFSYWGKNDMRSYLENNDIVLEGDVGVFIDGKEIHGANHNDDESDGPNSDPDADGARNAADDDDDGDDSKQKLLTIMIIIGASVGGLCICLAFAYLVLKSKTTQKAKSFEVGGVVGVVPTSGSLTSGESSSGIPTSDSNNGSNQQGDVDSRIMIIASRSNEDGSGLNDNSGNDRNGFGQCPDAMGYNSDGDFSSVYCDEASLVEGATGWDDGIPSSPGIMS